MTVGDPSPVRSSVVAALAGLVAGCILIAACTPVTPTPSPPATPAGTALQVQSKGAPTVTIRLNGAEAARVPCNGGVLLKPGEAGAPSLPWNLEVVDQANGRLMLSQPVTELPRWLLVQRDFAGISTSPILGPFVPCN